MEATTAQLVLTIHYRLDSSGFKPRWRRDFPNPARLDPRPTQSPVQWVLGLYPLGKWPGLGTDHPPPTNAEVKETEELYLCSLTPLKSLHDMLQGKLCLHLYHSKTITTASNIEPVLRNCRPCHLSIFQYTFHGPVCAGLRHMRFT